MKHSPEDHWHRVGLFVAVRWTPGETDPMGAAERWLNEYTRGSCELVRAEVMECAPDKYSDPRAAIVVPIAAVSHGAFEFRPDAVVWRDASRLCASVRLEDDEAGLLYLIRNGDRTYAYTMHLADIFHSLGHIVEGTHCRGPLDPEVVAENATDTGD